jgi:hypothetical protein
MLALHEMCGLLQVIWYRRFTNVSELTHVETRNIRLPREMKSVSNLVNINQRIIKCNYTLYVTYMASVLRAEMIRGQVAGRSGIVRCRGSGIREVNFEISVRRPSAAERGSNGGQMKYLPLIKA